MFQKIFFLFLLCSMFHKLPAFKECLGCIDYYGTCRQSGDNWVDDETWQYLCMNNQSKFTGCISTGIDSSNGKLISPNSNSTINGFWFSCTSTDKKLKYEQESRCIINETTILHVEDTFKDGIFKKICKSAGLWVLGCFYNDETRKEQFLPVGQSTYVGLVGHNCKEISSNPGRIQYWTNLKPNVTIAMPNDRGKSENLPQNVSNLLINEPKPWSLFNAEYFIKSNSYDVKIRNLI